LHGAYNLLPDERTLMPENPSRTPHLHVRSVEGFLFPEAVAITGNRKALLQLRRQIDRALKDETSWPFDEALYRDVYGEEYEVAVKLARSRGEMEEPVPKPEKTPERLPWTERVTRTREGLGETERRGRP
jgi:hypothetical protein